MSDWNYYAEYTAYLILSAHMHVYKILYKIHLCNKEYINLVFLIRVTNS